MWISGTSGDSLKAVDSRPHGFLTAKHQMKVPNKWLQNILQHLSRFPYTLLVLLDSNIQVIVGSFIHAVRGTV